MFFGLSREPRARIVAESRQILALALPIMVAQVAHVAMGFVDTVMSGRVSTNDLAAVSLGSSVFITVYVTLIGIATALNPLIAHLFGAGEREEIGETVRQGLWFCLFLGLIGSALMIFGQPWLRDWLTLSSDVEDKVMLFLDGVALGMPAAMMQRALHAFASSLNKPRPIMLVGVAALLLNIPLNYALIHGLYGLPAMGGAGCGWATAAALWFNLLALLGYIVRHPHFQPYAFTHRWSWPDWSRYGAMLKLGLPIGLSFFFEVSLFSFIAFLVAKLGTTVVASHQAVINVSSIIYMLPQSISTAMSVRVGQAVGAGDYHQARFTAGTGLLTGLVLAGLTMLLMLALREDIIRLYTTDPEVIRIGAGLLFFAAVFQLTDATQSISSGALRGYKITTGPMIIHVVSFWGLGLGLGMVLGLSDWPLPFLALPMGIEGFWAALVFSLSVAAVLLVGYLSRESRRRLVRQHTES
ncbi:MATE family efflux transporter [Pseudogulbenkiania sp. MAI-1]|uniref:MATE family efflux transporter n=1 Tax=Pseudogulbenkiania sp. MAI-1 TaxID=990370 RepID=UPI00045E7B32|nr:MATE family efflux transporter [Pseudogulbenkiania sp. MAI-1]